MFAIIEYVDYRKEIDIKIHGYTDNIKNAVDYSNKELLKKTDNKSIYIVVNNDDYESNNETYVTLSSNNNSKVIYKLVLIEIDKVSETECDNILSKILEKKELFNKKITIKELIEYFEFDCLSDDLKNEFEFSEIIENKKDLQIYIINYLILNNYNHMCKFININSNICSNVYGIVEIQNLSH